MLVTITIVVVESLAFSICPRSTSMVTTLLKSRQTSILRDLSKSVGGIPLATIMERYHVSRRTVYYDVTKIDEWLSERDNGRVHFEGQVVIADGVRWDKVGKSPSTRGHRYFSVEERQAMVLLYIALSPEQVTINWLMGTFEVSRNTVIADIRALKSEAKALGLEIGSTNSAGYTMQKRWSTYFNYPSCAMTAPHHNGDAPMYFVLNILFTKMGLDKIKADPKSIRKKIGFMSGTIQEELGQLKTVTDVLESAGFTWKANTDVEPEPCWGSIQRGVEEMRGFEPDWVIGFGGGSAMRSSERRRRRARAYPRRLRRTAPRWT